MENNKNPTDFHNTAENNNAIDFKLWLEHNELKVIFIKLSF